MDELLGSCCVTSDWGALQRAFRSVDDKDE
jgi:hypothetical protein